MPPALETIEATGLKNESKYRSGRGTGLLVIKRALVSHTFVFVSMQEFGYYILFGACRNEEIPVKLLKVITHTNQCARSDWSISYGLLCQ